MDAAPDNGTRWNTVVCGPFLFWFSAKTDERWGY
jgi:hypothetical protein